MPFYGGSFLVARSSLTDPNFRQSVVLLVQHNVSGAFGLVVNRPMNVKDLRIPVFSGGPCETDGLFFVHGHENWLEHAEDLEKVEVAPGIFLGDATTGERINTVSDSEISRVRMFAGCSGWGPGQLESELAEGAWTITSASGSLLFDIPASELWSLLKPPSIPQPSVN